MLLKTQLDQEEFNAEKEIEGMKLNLEQERFDAEQEIEGVKLNLKMQQEEEGKNE